MATPHYETIISAVKTLIDEGSVVTRGEAHDAMLRMTDELEKMEEARIEKEKSKK